jgi:hypothetical protein
MYENYPYSSMVGGKVNIGKSFRKSTRKLTSGFNKGTEYINPMAYAVKDPTLNKGMRDIGKYTQKQILPAVVSTGIPIASTAVGALASMAGGPIAGELASGMTQGLMEEYIPKKYQSDNPYVDMLGDALSMGLSGDVDPSMMMMQYPQYPQYQQPKYVQSKYQQPVYNPDNPYADIIMRLMMKNQPQTPVIDNNALSDATYKESELGKGADSLVIKSPPYQQKEGNTQGLLGAGIKKKRGRKPKKYESVDDVEIYIKKKLPHQKFSHAKNTALDQLLEATAEKEDKKARRAMEDMVYMQSSLLKEMGFEPPRRRGDVRGGMIEEEDDKPIKPAPLVRPNRQQRQQDIDETLENLEDIQALDDYLKPEELEDLNVMNLITDDWKELDGGDRIKRLYVLRQITREIDPHDNPLGDAPNILPFQHAQAWRKAGRRKEQYDDEEGERAYKVWKKNKKKVWEFFNVKEGTGIKRGIGFKKGSAEAKAWGKKMKEAKEAKKRK